MAENKFIIPVIIIGLILIVLISPRLGLFSFNPTQPEGYTPVLLTVPDFVKQNSDLEIFIDTDYTFAKQIGGTEDRRYVFYLDNEEQSILRLDRIYTLSGAYKYKGIILGNKLNQPGIHELKFYYSKTSEGIDSECCWNAGQSNYNKAKSNAYFTNVAQACLDVPENNPYGITPAPKPWLSGTACSIDNAYLRNAVINNNNAWNIQTQGNQVETIVKFNVLSEEQFKIINNTVTEYIIVNNTIIQIKNQTIIKTVLKETPFDLSQLTEPPIIYYMLGIGFLIMLLWFTRS